jgi:hypothetical protein
VNTECLDALILKPRYASFKKETMPSHGLFIFFTLSVPPGFGSRAHASFKNKAFFLLGALYGATTVSSLF